MIRRGRHEAVRVFSKGGKMAYTVAKVINEARKYIGLNEDDGSYKTLIDVYNSQDPLPGGYRMKYSDPWCAAGLTAIFMLAGMKDVIPAECNAERMYSKGKTVIPITKIREGDLIFYDWNTDGKRDHVGIIEGISNNIITVIECNYNNRVGRRLIHIDSPTINGIIRPEYDTETVETGHTIQYAKAKSDYFKGIYDITASDFLNLRTGSGTEYEIIEQMYPGDTVTCYGYFTPDKDHEVWLYVIHDSTGSKGYASYKYLKYRGIK